jgi:ABC-type molybdate transport system substrate-binding protein
MRGLAVVVVAAAVLAGAACRPRPDVRVLADERLAVPMAQIVALYEQRTRRQVHVALSSRGRMDVMLVSGKDDMIFAEAAQVDARPATGGLDRASRRDFAAREGTESYAVIVRERAAGRAEVRAFWQFALEAEARAILESAGFAAP